MRVSFGASAVAAAGLLLLALAGPLYRAGVPLSGAFSVVQWSIYLSLAGAAVSLAAVFWARRGNRRGAAAAATAGVLLGLLTAAVGYGWLRQAQGAPQLHDVSTDLENPPLFRAAAAARPSGANPLSRTSGIEQLQRQHYPDITPITLAQPPRLVFDRARLVAENQGWTLVDSDADGGRLEATDTTWWFGFTDDIVVRLTPWGSGTRVDVRSVSRYGETDTGTNARRIRRFLAALQEP
jgi:uncharacterized protein (DUF1499 family)